MRERAEVREMSAPSPGRERSKISLDNKNIVGYNVDVGWVAGHAAGGKVAAPGAEQEGRDDATFD
jgi:hypothetical protein